MGLRVGEARQDSKSLINLPGQGGTPGRWIKDPAPPNLGKPEVRKEPSSRIEIESKRQANGRFDGVCWRRSADVRIVLEANISTLKGGLRKARIEAAKLEASWVEDWPPEIVSQTKKKAYLYLEKYKIN